MKNRALSPRDVRTLRATVYGHFRRFGRDLPWRHTRDPYHIAVSEIMLQQTQVGRVAVKYPQFIARFPRIGDCAAASFPEVLAQWQGLGYNRRAKYVHGFARAVVALHAGRVPESEEALRSLPGIGPATAASIRAFAFDRPAVFIETNVRAVFIHHFFRGRAGVRDGEIRPLVGQALDRRNPRRWYSALMDYGAALKKEHGNPARRSARHVRQARFEGSRRQARGALLRALGAGGTMGRAALISAARADAALARQALRGLVSDGLVERAGRRYRIAAGPP